MRKFYVLSLTLLSLCAFGQITEISNINPSGDSDLDELYSNNGILYFEASDGTTGNEPYLYDGTTVSLIKDINTTSFANGGSNPGRFIAFNGLVYFKASDGDEDDGNNETELWQTDGTESGTTLVADINPTASGNPQDFFVFNNELYFEVNDVSSTQIWALNSGTPIKVTDNNGGGFASPSAPLVFSAGVFIRMNSGNGDNAHIFDGTTATELGNVATGTERSRGLFNNEVYFEGDDGSGIGDELWKTDGTIEGTVLVGDLFVGSDNLDPRDFVEYNGELYFAAEDADGYNLWKTDGTSEGTSLVSNPNTGGDSNVGDLFTDGINLYFTGTDGTVGLELWKFDGTTVSLLKDINGSGDSFPFQFTSLGGTVFFIADDGSGDKLWFTDGTTAGTQSVSANVGSGEDPIDVSSLTVLGAELIFSGTGDNGNELFSFDPTTLSISEATLLDRSISVYPNPATSIINVKSSSERHFSYSINDINGRQLQIGKTINSQIQIDLASGLYILQLEDENNTKISKKFVVE